MLGVSKQGRGNATANHGLRSCWAHTGGVAETRDSAAVNIRLSGQSGQQLW
jgi:hypothetical protein